MFLFPASIITLEKIFFLPTQKPCKIPYKFFPASNNLKLMLLTETITQTIRNTLINLKYIFFSTQMSSTLQPDSWTLLGEPLVRIRKLADPFTFNDTK